MKFQQWSPNLIICKWHLLTTNAQSFSFLGKINKYIEHKNGNTTNISEMALSNSRIQLNINNSHFLSESIEKLWKLSVRFINLPVTAHEKKKNFKNAFFANTEKKKVFLMNQVLFMVKKCIKKIFFYEWICKFMCIKV